MSGLKHHNYVLPGISSLSSILGSFPDCSLLFFLSDVKVKTVVETCDTLLLFGRFSSYVYNLLGTKLRIY